jgi:hypothetical protein
MKRLVVLIAIEYYYTIRITTNVDWLAIIVPSIIIRRKSIVGRGWGSSPPYVLQTRRWPLNIYLEFFSMHVS